MSMFDFFSTPDNGSITVEWTVYSVLLIWLNAGLTSKNVVKAKKASDNDCQH